MLWLLLRRTGEYRYFKMKYCIRALSEFSDDGEKLYWNNEYGWVNFSEADYFSLEEYNIFNLPIGGYWERA